MLVTQNVDAAIVLGSGLAGAFDESELEIVGEIGSGVEGHRGALALWRRSAGTVLVALGRRHLYEGIDPVETMRTVELAHSLGARHLVVTNAAGGLNPHYRVGDIMLIAGLNALMLGQRLPLLQGRDNGGDGGDMMSGAWAGGVGSTRRHDGEVRRGVVARALGRGVRVHEGVYAAVTGPSYETRAEVRMLRLMGADAVGMSTVPEYTAAGRLGMPVTGLSLITNTLSDTARVELDHSDVVVAGMRARRAMRLAIEAALDESEHLHDVTA